MDEEKEKEEIVFDENIDGVDNYGTEEEEEDNDSYVFDQAQCKKSDLFWPEPSYDGFSFKK